MKVRIGIDVGGTFTDVVVIDSQSHELVGQLKLPTTHVAREGVALGIVSALERAMAEFSLKAEDVAFIASKHLHAHPVFVGINGATEAEIDKAIQQLSEKGVRVVVASEAFSVDQTEHEELIAAKARAKGLFATAGHEVSSLYGLRVRTRTAVINAAILPKMIETA